MGTCVAKLNKAENWSVSYVILWRQSTNQIVAKRHGEVKRKKTMESKIWWNGRIGITKLKKKNRKKEEESKQKQILIAKLHEAEELKQKMNALAMTLLRLLFRDSRIVMYLCFIYFYWITLKQLQTLLRCDFSGEVLAWSKQSWHPFYP